jgi:hypothetical protein
MRNRFLIGLMTVAITLGGSATLLWSASPRTGTSKSGVAIPQEATSQQGMSKADLVVNLTTTSIKLDYPGEGICDSISADFTVTNIGQREARDFLVTVETKNKFHDWKPFWKIQVQSLKGGESRTEKGGLNERWCPGDKQTGFRVTADSENNMVDESNEHNNDATALFPAIPHGIMPKHYQRK